jgi:5-deoxy-glucuronate isomerase
MEHLIRSDFRSKITLDVPRKSSGWDYLRYRVLALQKGDVYEEETGGDEIALVLMEGACVCTVGDARFELSRKSVFAEKPTVLYVPPGERLHVHATSPSEFAVGGAPAEGKYPVRLFRPDEMKSEVRGGGAARRQVVHILAPPLPAERLILYEVYVPGGCWSGYPPHCHDRFGGSPYLEETYHFRISPAEGVALHRNYRTDTDFEEIFSVQDRDLVLVTQGFHSTAAAPGSNVYFLNYLAGELYDEQRATPPFDDPRYAWIKENWEANPWKLPVV